MDKKKDLVIQTKTLIFVGIGLGVSQLDGNSDKPILSTSSYL